MREITSAVAWRGRSIRANPGSGRGVLKDAKGLQNQVLRPPGAGFNYSGQLFDMGGFFGRMRGLGFGGD